MDKPESRIITFCKAAFNFFKCTDLQLSLKNSNIEGEITKAGGGFMLGVGQGNNRTDIEYKDNKVKVSHSSVLTGKEEPHDIEDS